MPDLKPVHVPRGYSGLHCEVAGCIVNIREGLTNEAGQAVTHIEILCDQYAGDPPWETDNGARHAAIRVIQRDTRTPPKER